MRFRRKAENTEASESTVPAETVESDPVMPVPVPRDAGEVRGDEIDRLDLGALLIEPADGAELRLQVDETSGVVQSVMLAGESGALEFAVFAAPRGGSLWTEVRPEIVADLTSRGAEVTEVEGKYGAELQVRAQVQLPDGQVGIQDTRIVGINGPRWMLRASFLGDPARDPEAAAAWEARLAHIVVDRGDQAMPVGTPLPVHLPDEARRVR